MRPEQARPVLLNSTDPSLVFPDPLHAESPLIAVGGDLSPERILQAYAQGIFPWFGEEDPILWWSPDPRGVLKPDAVHISRSLRKHAGTGSWQVRLDGDFAGVLDDCAAPRSGQGGTWITDGMRSAYLDLFAAGHGHCVEVLQHGQRVGGLYGVAQGALFFGESMFSRVPDASKIALVWLAKHLSYWNFGLIDTQFLTPHLQSMGAGEMTRAEFLQHLALLKNQPTPHAWQAFLSWDDVFWP
ncbi:leucyl/phenylalanyl-tRNA--protein transferase [Acidithiobacillus montserratensis]|uniref:Leucyl/phenylalanyl-tRNA--protein transferase n=1 Tax=Acidithiobacillus montserratensis TaxID=2729135 RepID=A0ACD5HFS2_9PROT|nr:leucyl/phenylalanyl-tRNA--protein transferase [Acidithiobacillus montserratensis]MBN2679659.1 leucyl/phenylalanyl-tRNA--protein transferase [Acidithiobacillaceae bacterium]MBU2747510.1 leucyl/phenylalanyl-tRNA--protein transferase [Acidithiobacillus montserratensis]